MLAHKLLMSSCLSFFKYDSFPVHLMDQSLVKQHLGTNSTNLKSRLEASEQYRKNAKRSNDPKVLFHYAQFMLQMALELKELEPKQQESKPPKFHSRSLSDSSTSSRRQPSLSLSNFTDNQIQMTMFLKEAQHYLKRLSDKGYVEAQYLLGDAWSSGAFGKVDDERAFGLFLLSAKHGHTESAFRVAHCYEEGLGTGRDARKCIELLKKAASEKHPAAMYKLGVYHFYAKMGIADTMTNKKMAINWLERASSVATELTAAAPYELGKIYYEGYKDIVIRDREYAVRLFTKAAALNHVEAAAKLGEHYEEGVDGLPSEHLSINYYTQAALLGHPGAMLALGAWYLCGAESLEVNEEEALLWIEKSS
ncbi:HCP-like protein, partial [Metschnikowia bicuspidata]